MGESAIERTHSNTQIDTTLQDAKVNDIHKRKRFMDATSIRVILNR